MTTTVQQLIESLQQFRADSVIAIAGVDDREFAIVGFSPEPRTVTILISETVEPSEEE